MLRQQRRRALAHTVAYGIAFLHEGLSADEQKAVCELHASGAVQAPAASASASASASPSP